tara:strand:- start:145 stop:390 length:246 start_codon:yes stop_codon:yes gene_type:complete
MTKNDLINELHSLKIDLKYLKKDLEFRMKHNDIPATIAKYEDMDHKHAWQSGAFQAMVDMDNLTYKRAIESIDKMIGNEEA